MEDDKNKEIINETNKSNEEKGSKIKSTVNFVKTKVNSVVNSGKEFVGGIIDDHKKVKDIENSIKNETYLFSFNDNTFRGFLDKKNPVCIYVPENQKIILNLYSGCVITSKNDSAKYLVNCFSKGPEEEITLNTDHGEEKIKCYYLSIDLYKPEIVPVNNYITNTVTQNINNSVVMGDANLISKINNDLDDLEKGINNIQLSKLSLITKRKDKDYLIENIGVFKEKVTNGTKDEGFFKKFLDALENVASALVSLAISIIGKI